MTDPTTDCDCCGHIGVVAPAAGHYVFGSKGPEPIMLCVEHVAMFEKWVANGMLAGRVEAGKP